MLGNLIKAAVSALATPVGVVADIVTLPASSYDPHRGPFDNTAALVKSAKDNFKEAVRPRRDDGR
jgi:hypothetical protein